LQSQLALQNSKNQISGVRLDCGIFKKQLKASKTVFKGGLIYRITDGLKG